MISLGQKDDCELSNERPSLMWIGSQAEMLKGLTVSKPQTNICLHCLQTSNIYLKN
jgi:hypothetical protein